MTGVRSLQQLMQTVFIFVQPVQMQSHAMQFQSMLMSPFPRMVMLLAAHALSVDSEAVTCHWVIPQAGSILRVLSVHFCCCRKLRRRQQLLQQKLLHRAKAILLQLLRCACASGWLALCNTPARRKLSLWLLTLADCCKLLLLTAIAINCFQVTDKDHSFLASVSLWVQRHLACIRMCTSFTSLKAECRCSHGCLSAFTLGLLPKAVKAAALVSS